MKIVDEMKNKKSQRQVAEEFGVSRRSVQEIYKKFLNTTSVADRYRSGRPAKTTLRERRHLIIMSKKKPFQSSTILQKKWISRETISNSTVKRILRQYGLYGRKLF